MALHFPITKVNKEKRTVSGFASLDNLDRHGDIVKAEASKKAFDNFRGNIREMHGPSAVGKMVSFKEDSFFDPTTQKKYNGIYVTAYISKGAQDAWEKCLDGTYSGFSIGGNIVDAKMEKIDDDLESHRVIHDFDLHELSLVDSPANQLANFMSIEKNDDGSSFIKGMVSEVILENVFWCKEDEIASTSESLSKECANCDTQMINIGWVEQKDIQKFEAVEEVINSYFKKDDAPTSTHAAGETAAPGLVGNVIDSAGTINDYPDQNIKSKITLSDGLKKSEDNLLNEGGNKMAENTDTAIEKSVDVESPAEETVEATEEDTSIEKAVVLSEVNETPDFEKAVANLKDFFTDGLQKNDTNYATHAATVADMFAIVEKTRAEMASVTKGYEDITKSNETLVASYDELKKTVDGLIVKIESLSGTLTTVEQATAIQKSVGVSAPVGQVKPKSLWHGAFLDASNL